MHKKVFFIASTGQNVGKTTTCLGLMAGLKKRFTRVGFMKPIGQEHVEIEKGLHIDKDVALFKEVYQLEEEAKLMSPVLFSKGFTRDWLDGKIDERRLLQKIVDSYAVIEQTCDLILIEGTGHVGVGSIVNLNNAQVACALGSDVILIGSGGLGSSFDALALNKLLCDQAGVHIAGVILNRVLPDKREMIATYFQKALARWGIPLLGCIPYNAFLDNPTMGDYAAFFDVPFLSGAAHRLRHFEHMRLMAASVEAYRTLIIPSQLVITPASREDIILATLSKHWELKLKDPASDLQAGLILTGAEPPKPKIVHDLIQADIPAFHTPMSSLDSMQKLASYIAKIRNDDTPKVQEAMRLVEGHIDFDLLLAPTTQRT